MYRITLRTLVLASLFASLAGAQSLGDVAKRERERREKNKAENVAVQEFSEEEIFDEEDDASAPAEDPADSDTPDEKRFDLGLLPSGQVGAEASGDDNDLDRARSERQRQEAMWRSRLAEARARIENARARKHQLEGLFLGEGQHYTDARGRVVIRSRAHLQQLVADATAELEAAEAALVALREEARRAGVPPGWLR